MKTGHEHLAFFKEAFKNLFKTGTVLPSSQFLSNKICKKATKYSPVDNPNIVEVGAGTGKITILLLKAFPRSHFWIFEPNQSFFKILKDRVMTTHGNQNNVIISNECIEHSSNIPHKCHIIVSSLPLLSLNKTQRNEILSLLSSLLENNGIFIQYGYTPLTEVFLKEHFKIIDRSLVPLNIPPAIVYVCNKKKNS